MDAIKFCSESHQVGKLNKAPERHTEIRFYSEIGDVDNVVALFQDFINDLPFEIKFTSAKIKQDLPRIPNNRKDELFYPLRLQAGNITVMLSEVRAGYRGRSSDAMIECLKIAGFEPNKKTLDKIYNYGKVDMTILKEHTIE